MLEIESLREFVLVPRDDSMDSPRSTLVKQVSATHIELHSKNLSRIVVIEALTSEPIYFHPVIGAESSNFALTPNSVRVHPVPRRGVVITESDW